jgi:hypothetical protein
MNAEGGMFRTRNGECGVRNELKERMKAFALGTVRLVEDLPRGRSDEAGRLVAIAVTSIRTARGARGSIPHSALHTPQFS